METQNNLTIECRINPHTEWFRVGSLENATLQEAKKFVEDVQKNRTHAHSYEYRIIES
jgi:hypothetical protein